MSLKKVTRYDLAQHGRVLATRPKGREAGRAVADQFAKSAGLLLSFNAIDVASPPFLDEVVRALRAQLTADTEGWLLVTGTNEDVRESLELVLERHKLALAALDGEQVALLGGSAHLADTLAEAQRMGTFTAPDLADRLRLKLPALHQRLNALLDAGALERTADSSARHGKRGLYRVPPRAEVEAARALPPAEQVEAVTAG
jgi:DNA-binding MarR family transcriptional regulator